MRSSWWSPLPTSSTSTSWMVISCPRSPWARLSLPRCGRWTDRVLHGHLMVDAPEAFFDELAEAGLDVVSFHHEAVGDPEPAIAKARAAGLRAGVTLNLETPVEAAFPYLEQIDDLMLMSIRPGLERPGAEPRRLPADRRGAGRGGPTRAPARHRDRRRGEGRERPARRGRGSDGARLGVRHLPGTRPGRRRCRTLAAIASGSARTREGRLMPEIDPRRRRRPGHRPVRGGEPPLGRLRRLRRGRRRRGARAGGGDPPRPRAPRRDDAAARRLRGGAAPPQEPADREHQHHHAHREGAVLGQGDRPAVRRGRLHHQAVRPDRAARAGEGDPAAREGDAQPVAAHGSARATSGSRRRSSGRSASTGPSRSCTSTSTTSRRTTTSTASSGATG